MDNTLLPAPTDLDDERLALRPWRPRDAPELFEAVRESISHLSPWLTWCGAGYALADAQSRIVECRRGWKSGELYAFAIHERATGQLLGSVGLSQLNHPQRRANLGYWIRQRHLGQGLAARASRRAARFGFERLKLTRIEIVIATDNRASRRTAEQVGARLEAIAHHRLRVRGRATDAAIYTLIPSDAGKRP